MSPPRIYGVDLLEDDLEFRAVDGPPVRVPIRVVQAAPDLLEACRAALATMPPEAEQSERELRATELLRAAISKAEGPK
jgi:hypothetical protein